MAIPFVLRILSADPVPTFSDLLTVADLTKGPRTYDGIDQPGRRHAVGTSSITAERPAVFMPLALAASQQVKLDVDFASANFRLLVLDAAGNIVAENDDGGTVDLGSPGTQDPKLTFTPPTSGVFVFVVTSFDNEYLGNWQFANDGTATGSFQLDISAPSSPITTVLTTDGDLFWGTGTTVYFLHAGDGDDNISMFGSGNSVVGGEAGDDFITGGVGHEVLNGGQGNDGLDGGGGNDLLIGGAGQDIIFGMSGDDEIHGGGGTDTLNGGDGDDLILAAKGDGVNAGTGNDKIIGDAEFVDAGAGDDVIIGGDGANTILTGDGNNTVAGGAGNDFIEAGTGDDDIDGGTGKDKLAFEQFGSAIELNLSLGTASGQGNDTFTGIETWYLTNSDDRFVGGNSSNSVFGLDGNDTMQGLAGKDRLFGDAGNDFLVGNQNADRLNGGDGNDVLVGGSGDDVLTGGASADLFIILFIGDGQTTGRDMITDFNQAGGDQIDIHEFRSSDDVLLAFIGMSAFTATGIAEVRYRSLLDNTLVEIDSDGDGSADVLIDVKGWVPFEASDFYL